MFEKEWLPYALSIGISYNDFWHMNPRRIKAFEEAHKLKAKMQDEQMWLMGIYIQSAVSVAVEHNLAGRKATSKYIEKPFLQNEIFTKNKELTEYEKQKAVDKFFAKENARRLNWKRNKKKLQQETEQSSGG